MNQKSHIIEIANEEKLRFSQKLFEMLGLYMYNQNKQVQFKLS